MDLFVKNLEEIRQIATKLHFIHGKRYEVNELINASYILFKRAITNNPTLLEKQFSKLTTLLFRVKSDMKCYIRDETNFRIQERLVAKGIEVPMFQNASFQKEYEEDTIPFEPSNTESGFEEFEVSDFLDKLFMEVHLENDEWDIIQGYFYDEKELKQIGQEIGKAECTISTKKKKMLTKMRPTALKLRESILK